MSLRAERADEFAGSRVKCRSMVREGGEGEGEGGDGGGVELSLAGVKKLGGAVVD